MGARCIDPNVRGKTRIIAFANQASIFVRLTARAVDLSSLFSVYGLVYGDIFAPGASGSCASA